MYLREYELECAVSLAKDGQEKHNRAYCERAAHMLQGYRRDMLRLKPGDRLEFGSYFLTGGAKPIKTFVRAPIVWRVLDTADGNLTLLSEYSLDWEFYGDVGACGWSDCYLRKWLNGECLTEWFAEEERSLMLTTVCAPERNQLSDICDLKSTEDRLFLLSFGELLQYFNARRPGKGWKNVKQYLFDKYTGHYPVGHPDAIGLIPFADQSFRDKKVVEISYEAKEWWLRTPGGSEERRMVVCEDGSVDVNGMQVGCDEVGVRPALRIDPRRLDALVAVPSGKDESSSAR